jgi:cell division protein FtsB
VWFLPQVFLFEEKQRSISLRKWAWQVPVKRQLQQAHAMIASYLVRSARRMATGVAILVALLLGYHAVFGANGLTAYQQKRTQHQVLQKEIQNLQQQNSRLKQHVDQLQSDPDAIEHEARVILRYAKPGEVIYALNDKPVAKQSPSK